MTRDPRATGERTPPVSDSDFYSFEKAIEKLDLEEDDLKRLISAGEIRAFRDGSKMRLRAEDVARVANDLGVGGEVAEEDAGEVLEVEEVLFSESADDEGMVTTQLSEEDTLLDDDLEVVEVAEEAAAAPRARAGAGRAAAQPEEPVSQGLVFATVATTVLMIWGLAFVVSMADGKPNAMTKPIVEAVHGDANS
jgi:excisionase family DNA binding protein